MIGLEKYPSLKRFSKSIKFSQETLVEAYKVERYYHDKILNEKNKIKRIKLYDELYSKVHPIYYKKSSFKNPKDYSFSRKVNLFKKELYNKSIIDVGCGKGDFLKSIIDKYKYKSLTGLDVSLPDEKVQNHFKEINFIKKDVTEFELNEKFDVVYSNHVFEHMSPVDVDTHLKSIVKCLKSDGTLILNSPNELFGPSDVTRIIDFSYTNKMKAQGSHLNESTYSKIIPILKKHGFKSFKSPFPHTIIRHLISSFRLNAKSMCKIEDSNKIMSLLHSLKYNKTCFVNFEVSIIAKL
jgi:2-polyprenyl-3-methyl-5-hydroxy-6-metoxy-1,4-benzoquinol methylase